MRTRLLGGVGGGRVILPPTRFGTSGCLGRMGGEHGDKQRHHDEEDEIEGADGRARPGQSAVPVAEEPSPAEAGHGRQETQAPKD